MANTKISALSSASTPLSGSEIVPINQSGVTDSVSVANLTAGRPVAASSITTTTGNSVFGTGSATTLATFGDNGTVGTTIIQVTRAASVSDVPGFQGIIAGVGGSDILLQPSANDVRIGAGNVVMKTAGKGINFTANTPASGMTSQNLTWYEEGTWTPSLQTGFTVNSGSFGGVGKYTRVGRLVTLSFVQTSGNITWIAGAYLNGLPFAPASPYAAGVYTNSNPNIQGSILVWASSTIYMASAQIGQTSLVFTVTYMV